MAQQVVNTVSAFIRAHWAEIRSTSIALGGAVRQGFAVAKQAMQAIMPVVRALAPVFSAAFSAALAILRAFAVVAATSMRLTAAEINIVKAVVRPSVGSSARPSQSPPQRSRQRGGHHRNPQRDQWGDQRHDLGASCAQLGESGRSRACPARSVGSLTATSLLPGHAAGGFVAGSSGSPQADPRSCGRGDPEPGPAGSSRRRGILKQMFGFTGGRGSGLRIWRHRRQQVLPRQEAPRAPHKGKARRSHTGSIPPWASPEIKGALSHLHRLDDDKQYLDQEYGNLVTRFQIEDGDQTSSSMTTDGRSTRASSSSAPASCKTCWQSGRS
jgi:hypothetical protein